RQMINSLDQVGLQAMECMGQDFDPNYHDAVMQEEAEEKDKGKVILEIQKGYLFNDKLLRPAMVKVGI
ncbi:MAG: nucleotide exchange factor GrpE, partial [Clostridiales bacterium]